MAIVVVGGHTRNIGKTSVVEGIIREFPEMRWTALKITQHDHGIPDTTVDAVAVSEERDASPGKDSARYLAAGAVRSLLVRIKAGRLADAMPGIRKELAGAENAVIESNSILQFLQPDVYLSVLDPKIADFKDSARLYLDRADAVLVPGGKAGRPMWDNVLLKLLEGTPVLKIEPPNYVTPEIVDFLTRRLSKVATMTKLQY